MSSCLQEAVRLQSEFCSLVALHRKQIPSTLFHLGRCRMSEKNSQSPLTSTKRALNPISLADSPFLYLSSKAAPSCLVDGKLSQEQLVQAPSQKLDDKVMGLWQAEVLGQDCKRIKRKSLASLLVSPGSAQVQHWMLSFLSHEMGTPSLHIANGQKEAPIFFSASSEVTQCQVIQTSLAWHPRSMYENSPQQNVVGCIGTSTNEVFACRTYNIQSNILHIADLMCVYENQYVRGVI